jgi:cytochrome b561
MRRPPFRSRKTDYGTIALHWLVVAALVVAVTTGLSIGAEAPDRTWINVLDRILPRSAAWTAHVEAAVALVAVAVAYAVYVALAGLGRRIRLDRIRLLGLFGRSQARWGAINIILYWLFYVTMLAELLTGGLLYFGYGSSALLNFHWIGMWAIVGYPVLHVLAHWRLGGTPQLLRVFRPAPLLPPPPPVDLAELVARLAESTRPPQAHAPERGEDDDAEPLRELEQPARDRISDRATTARAAAPPGRSRTGGTVLQANPLVVATAAALVGVGVLLTVDRETIDTLHIQHIAEADVPVLDGDSSDPIWRTAPPVSVPTEGGGNFDGKGETTIEIRAVHDGEWAYFLFVWNDPTRSLKQLPLVKTADGWRLLHHGHELGDEHAYNEDKFSALLTKSDFVLAGDRTFHAGPVPAAGKPGTLHGRGLHYTNVDSIFADVWQWKATSTGASGRCDNDYFGPLAEPTPAQLAGKAPYHGGFAPSPGTAAYLDNFAPIAPEEYDAPIRPTRLPKDVAATMRALGRIDLDPSHGESDGARWYITEEESTPYSRELDARIPEGAVVPGVIVAGEYSGERGSIRCAARWQAGRWALEAARRLYAKGKYQVAIGTGTFMRVAAFDHSQIRHTRHVRPIRLEVE